MSTTRHLVNRRRRLEARPRTEAESSASAAEELQPVPKSGSGTAQTDAGNGARTASGAGTESGARTGAKSVRKPSGPGAGSSSAARASVRPGRRPRTEPSGAAAAAESAEGKRTPRGRFPTAVLSRLGRAPRTLPVVCAVLTLVFGGFAGWAASEARELRNTASAHNSALADAARTSEVKGEVSSAVNALFSYDHAHPEKNERAADRLLTGRAVEQHRALLARVRAQDRAQKLVLTTTVTDSAVTELEGDRARVLLFADQHSARTAGKAGSADGSGGKSEGEPKDKAKNKDKSKADDGNATYAGAMLAVNAVRKDGAWRITAIDTLD
ncbi:hypothetical protein AB0939_04430 [Streptomyces sp. NPDC006990]|uniref:hypothetical protein n=1 Tax=Streptomyces sp. NPDC006990 TaxID=3154481 RepID=UPI0034569774